MTFHAYMLRCSDGSYYLGQTDMLERRMAQHEAGEIEGYTQTRRPVELVWSQEFASRDEAIAAEQQIKGWSRNKKEALIAGDCAAISALARKSFDTGLRQAQPLLRTDGDARQPAPVIVLVRPQLGENIGKAARAMLNFGLTEMRLVSPRDGWPNPASVAMASGAGRLLDDAILSGKIRALDALLVARPGSEATDWASAKATCRRKKTAGLPGWQLPSRSELSRLRRARMLEDGTFWSRERGPHDDDAYATVASSGVVNVYLQVEPAAKVQCVRKR